MKLGSSLFVTLLLSVITFSAKAQQASHKLKLSIPSMSLLRVADQSGGDVNGATLTLQSAVPVQSAGGNVSNLFPFTTNTYYLQYTYIAGPRSSRGAKITVERSAFTDVDFTNETKLFVNIGNTTSYNSGHGQPQLGGNSKVEIPVTGSANVDIIKEVYSGWTGVAAGDGTPISYEWDLKQGPLSNPATLSGKTETTQITYTIVEY